MNPRGDPCSRKKWRKSPSFNDENYRKNGKSQLDIFQKSNSLRPAKWSKIFKTLRKLGEIRQKVDSLFKIAKNTRNPAANWKCETLSTIGSRDSIFGKEKLRKSREIPQKTGKIRDAAKISVKSATFSPLFSNFDLKWHFWKMLQNCENA